MSVGRLRSMLLPSKSAGQHAVGPHHQQQIPKPPVYQHNAHVRSRRLTSKQPAMRNSCRQQLLARESSSTGQTSQEIEGHLVMIIMCASFTDDDVHPLPIQLK